MRRGDHRRRPGFQVWARGKQSLASPEPRSEAGRLGLSFTPDPFVTSRAHQVLDEAVALLRRIRDEGLLAAIGDGTFGVTRRPADGGRGLDGVIEKGDGYWNPATEILEGTGGPSPRQAGLEAPDDHS